MATEKDIFSNLRTTAEDVEKSYRWFQSQIKRLGSRVNPNRLMQNSSQLQNSVNPGEMYLFFYDPKHKKTLPYYDTFPLALPFRAVSDGFYAINLHYMPYLVRYRLLQNLSDLVTNNKYDSTTKIKISWSILNRYARLAPLAGSVKHYLSDHVKSRFLKIDYPDWVTASQLPIEQFEGADKTKVWLDSRKKSGQ